MTDEPQVPPTDEPEQAPPAYEPPIAEDVPADVPTTACPINSSL
jgi:hypothetical protein